MFFKLINKKPLKRGFKRLSGLYAALKIRELVVTFLMSRTGYHYVLRVLKTYSRKRKKSLDPLGICLLNSTDNSA